MSMQDDHRWLVELVQGRYQPYNLSFEQAEAVLRFEQERDVFSEKHLFSQWEQLDFELVTFREILKGEQLSLYLEDHEAAVQAHEKELIEWDNGEEQQKQLVYTERINAYYKDELIPGLLKMEEVNLYRTITRMRDNKIDYLKEEFKKYLSVARKRILINHFRHNRTFRPNELKLALLRHSLNDVWPFYDQFYQSMDAPTKAVADFVDNKAALYFKNITSLLEQSIKDTRHFVNNLSKEIFTNRRGGWSVVIEPTPEEELKTFRMSLLLMDTSVLNTPPAS